MSSIIDGLYDLHVHSSPDVRERKCSDNVLAERALKAGMKGFVIKAHYFDTAARAGLVRERYPQLDVIGGVVMNRSVGGLNPEAVLRCAEAGGKIVWFPTMDSLSYQRYHTQKKDPSADLSRFIKVCGDDGALLPAAREVIKMAADHDMVVATGHISPQEGMAVVRYARELGCRAIVTHADNPADLYSDEQQIEAAKLGAMIEHSFFTVYFKRTTAEEIVRQIRLVGIESVILSTDFGQTDAPYFDEGLEMYFEALSAHGLSLDEYRAAAGRGI